MNYIDNLYMEDILLVEDNLEVAKEIKLSLEKWGMKVQLIEDFSNVLEEVVKKQPKLVLMDVNLPYYDGFYWCGRIREVSKLPILFLSSRDSNMDLIMGINTGGDDYITKPFDTQVLLSKINALLRSVFLIKVSQVRMGEIQRINLQEWDFISLRKF